MKQRLPLALLGAALLIALSACAGTSGRSPDSAHAGWSAQEQDVLESLSLGTLPAPPADPSNAVADDSDAANLGHALFFDAQLSSDGQVSCSSCHDPKRGFTDGLALAEGVGKMNRKSMSVVGAAYSPWLFWDGRKDSLWAQALGPLEQPAEHDFTRGEVAQFIARAYALQYEPVFGDLPDLSDPARFPPRAAPAGDAAAQAAWASMSPADRETVTRVFVNVGKAIAAFERQLEPEPTRFDAYAAAVRRGDPEAARLFSPDEAAGLRLFIGEAGCVQCHSGPLFMDGAFHNTGVPAVPGLPADLGRQNGVKLVAADEFNCLSRYSDAAPSQCRTLQSLEPAGPGLERAYKVPSLRGAAARPPYMHAGQFGTLAAVLKHYNRAPAAVSGQSELEPLGLSDAELGQLEAFLQTLSDASPAR